MKKLQETLPVLFELVLLLGHYPLCVTPILKEMLGKATSPFSDQHEGLVDTLSACTQDELKTLCFFPTLPAIRRRRSYESDSAKKTTICTKKHAGHPSLTPGVFTLFCHHGTAMLNTRLQRTCEWLRDFESPHIPHTPT